MPHGLTESGAFSRMVCMSQYCQIVHVDSDSDVGTPCNNRAVAECADCGTAICADCRTWCCGQSFCESCGDYHVTAECVRKPVQNVPLFGPPLQRSGRG